jgi:hypothetical protein
MLGEGQRFLIACAGDQEAAVLRLQFDGDFAKQLLVFTEELGGAGNRVSERRSPSSFPGTGVRPFPSTVRLDDGGAVGKPAVRVSISRARTRRASRSARSTSSRKSAKVASFFFAEPCAMAP